jgi:glycosyltransferase involved in cell wall biosynthesis
MCAYNTERYIGAAIQSILDQTMPDLELIVVDDSSHDGTWAIIQAYAASDPRVVAARTPHNMGAAGALNVGLARARGRFITRQDSDDLATPDRLEKQLAFLSAHPDIGAVAVDALYVETDGRPIEATHYPTDNDEIQARLPIQTCLVAPSLLIRRAALESAGFWMDEELSGSEDYDIAVRLAEVARMANLPEPLYIYRQHAASVSHMQRSRQMYRMARAQEKAVHRRHGSNPGAERLRPVAHSFLRAAVLAAGSGHKDEAQDYLHRVLALDSSLLDAEQPVTDIITRYTNAVKPPEAVMFVERVFTDLLPPTPPMVRVRNRLLARLHMTAVFAAAQRGDGQTVDAHLWAGIRRDPKWLLNRGVVTLVARRAVAHKEDPRSSGD